MFTPIFSFGFIFLWGVLFGGYIGTTWWTTGQYPSSLYRALIGVLAAVAAYCLEAALARRHQRRTRPVTRHRKEAA